MSNTASTHASKTPDHSPAINGSPDEMLSISQASKISRRPKSTIEQWAKTGKLKVEQLEGLRMVSKLKVLELDKTSPKKPTAEPNPQMQSVVGSEPTTTPEPPSVQAEGPTRPTNPPATVGELLIEGSQQQDAGDSPSALTSKPVAESKIPIKDVSFDPETQIRERTDDKVVTEYSEKMKKGEKFPPVILFFEKGKFYIGDGWHRLMAAKKNGYPRFPAQVYPGGKSAAIRHALKANVTHGLRLTSADKRRKVGIALQQYPGLSSNEIADICGVSESLVRTHRSTFVKNEPAERTGADGKKYPARKPKQQNNAGRDKALFRRAAKLIKRLKSDSLLLIKNLIEQQLAGQAPSATKANP